MLRKRTANIVLYMEEENTVKENTVRMRRIVHILCFSGLAIASLSASGEQPEQPLPGAERHRWRMQHTHGGSEIIASESYRYHFGAVGCVEGPGTCDMKY